MRALRGAISLQTPGHHRPARSLAVCHLLGCSRIRPLRCFAQMSLNRHLTEVCWIQHTRVRPTCGGCPFMDVWWLGSWTPLPRAKNVVPATGPPSPASSLFLLSDMFHLSNVSS